MGCRHQWPFAYGTEGRLHSLKGNTACIVHFRFAMSSCHSTFQFIQVAVCPVPGHVCRLQLAPLMPAPDPAHQQPAHRDCLCAGEMEGLTSLLATTSEPELQAVLLESLLQAPTDALEAISYDVQVLTRLNEWLPALMEDPRAFHIIELLLKVGAGGSVPRRTCSPCNVALSSGVAAFIALLCNGSSDVACASVALLQLLLLAWLGLWCGSLQKSQQPAIDPIAMRSAEIQARPSSVGASLTYAEGSLVWQLCLAHGAAAAAQSSDMDGVPDV